MSWSVDDHVFTQIRSKRELCRVDGDILLLFLQQGIEKECKLEVHSFGLTRLADLLDFPFG